MIDVLVKLFSSSYSNEELGFDANHFQIVGGKTPGWHGRNSTSNDLLDAYGGENYWPDLDTDLYHWTKSLRPVQVGTCR